jgi:hypothetical protein
LAVDLLEKENEELRLQNEILSNDVKKLEVQISQEIKEKI